MYAARMLFHTRSRASRGYLLVVATVAVAVGLAFASASHATPPLSATSTSASEATSGQSNSMPGVALAGGLPDATLRVSVSTDVGTLSMTNNPSGLTLASGYSSWTNRAEIAFTGVQADINSALATLTLNPGASSGVTAHMQINAQPFVSGLVYAPGNGHYYKYVAENGVDFLTARAHALLETYGGQAGYLATIPSSDINSLIAEKIPGAENVWFGALATNTPGDAVKRTWEWTDGPLAGTDILQCTTLTDSCAQTGGPWPLASLWASGEPNNYNSGENAAVTNWGSVGEWNDLPDTGAGGDGFVVEFGDQATGSSTPFTGTATATASVSVIGTAGPPTNINVTTHGDKATVTWTPPSNNGGSTITSYTATASSGGGSCTVAPPATSCTIDGLTIGGSYTFTVTAGNGMGSSGSSSPSSPATPTVATPEPATNATVTVVDATNLQIGWSPSADDGGEQVSYTVVAEPGGHSCTSTSNSCTISGLEADRAYTFSIVASNSAGSASAATASASTPAAASAVSPPAVSAGPPPLLTDVRFASHRVSAIGRTSGIITASVAKSKKRKRTTGGTKLYLTSSEAATLTFRVQRDLPGRLRGGKCRAKRKGTTARGKYCVIREQISVPAAGLSVNAGSNVLTFTGRIGTKRLKPGLYHVTFRLTDVDGNVSNSRGDWVRVIRRR